MKDIKLQNDITKQKKNSLSQVQSFCTAEFRKLEFLLKYTSV